MIQVLLPLLLLMTLCKALPGQEQSFKDLKLIFVHGNETNVFDIIELSETEKLLNHPRYNNKRPTMMYAFGYTEKFSSISTQTIVESYISRDDHNILVIEWSNYSRGSYIFEAIPNSYKVGEFLGKKLLEMRTIGFDLDNFHLVGHSLGGQLVGFIGRSYFSNSNQTKKIRRITALDPAGPIFYGIGSRYQGPITKDDGVFVDVIHTDMELFGAPTSTGTVDFWPNGGKEQPNCPPANYDVYNEENFCSHRRSWAYYSESVRTMDDDTFHSISCLSWLNFTQNDCGEQSSVQALMGFNADPSLPIGDYFLETNGELPWNRGENGTRYAN